MNPGLGLVVELLGFAAAGYVLFSMRRRYPPLVTDAMLAAIGAAMGAGALLFQRDVSVAGGLLAPAFAASLLVAHTRALGAMGVRVPVWTPPTWADIPPLRGREGYADPPTMSQTIEDPVPQPGSAAEPEPESQLDTDDDPMTELDEELTPMQELDEEELAPPLGPATSAPPTWPQTIVGARTAARLPRHGARRTRVEIRRLSPFSVLKFSVIFYFCVFLVIYLALAIIWAVLSASGVIDAFEKLLGTIFPSGSGISPTGQVSTRGAPPLEIDTGQVFTWLFVAGCVGVAIWSLINVFVAVMYNLISDIVGGVEVTLADRRGE